MDNYCESKYRITATWKFGSGYRIFAQFGSGSGSGVMLSIFDKKNSFLKNFYMNYRYKK